MKINGKKTETTTGNKKMNLIKMKVILKKLILINKNKW